MKLDQDNTSQCGTQKNSHLSPNEQLSPLKVSVVRFILFLKGDITLENKIYLKKPYIYLKGKQKYTYFMLIFYQ